MSHLRKVRTGDPLRIPANAYNAFVDAAAAHRRSAFGQSHTLPRITAADRDVVLAFNGSGSDVDAFSVMGIDGVYIEPDENLSEFQQRPCLSVTTPSLADHYGQFVIVLEAIPASACGRAVVTGITAVQVNVTDADHRYADISDAEPGYLASAEIGAAEILYKPAGTGVLWCLVRLGVKPAELAPDGDEGMVLQIRDVDGVKMAVWGWVGLYDGA